MALTCIDLFSGAGGMSEGFRSIGIEPIAALEAVAPFARTHQLNFPACATVVAKAEELAPGSFERAANLRTSPDVIIGGPPCQTFSTIGRAKIRHVSKHDPRHDPRNYLYKTFLDYVAYFKPKAFVLENVPQLRTKHKGVLFDALIGTASEFGYDLHITVLNAAEHGVPQNRKRLFIVGTPPGASFGFPAPSTDPLRGTRTRTVREALEDLPAIQDGCRLGALPYSRSPTTEYQRYLRSKTGLVGNNVCRVSNDRAKRVFRHMKPGDRYMDLPADVRKILPFREDIFFDRLKRLHPDQPSWTVLAHIGMDGYMYIHPWEDRTLSVREAARLQSFPDDFTFVGNMREQYVQVGNAVPPILAAAVAEKVREAIQ